MSIIALATGCSNGPQAAAPTEPALGDDLIGVLATPGPSDRIGPKVYDEPGGSEIRIYKSSDGTVWLVERWLDDRPHGAWEATTASGEKVLLMFEHGRFLGTRAR